MSEQELRARLQRALHTRISAAEWLDIKDQGHVCDYDDEKTSWRDLCEIVDEVLRRLRRYVENTQREQRGELLLETKSPERLPEPTTVTDIRAPLSERTAARVGALNALDQLRLGPKAWGPVVREISSRVRPEGGFDQTLSQWVIELKIEAWVPAEDVRSIYQHVQRDLLAEEARTKTQPRTFRVAQFVWEEELRCGERPSWPVLLERWKERNPDDEGFKDRRAFRTCFKRGAEAAPPRYARGNDYIAGEATRLRQMKEQWDEGPQFGLRPY
jgi:hypothetical protein